MDPITAAITTMLSGWLPLAITAVSIVLGLVVKDLLSTFAHGLMFYLDKDFQIGDNVYVDSELATIINIKLTRTVFRMADNGNWRFVHNSKVRYLKLEKVIEPTEAELKKLKS